MQTTGSRRHHTGNTELTGVLSNASIFGLITVVNQ